MKKILESPCLAPAKGHRRRLRSVVRSGTLSLILGLTVWTWIARVETPYETVAPRFEESLPVEAPGVSRDPAMPSEAGTVRWLGYRAGDRLRYDVANDSLILFSDGGQGGGEGPPPGRMGQRMRGTLLISVYDETVNEWTMGFRFDEARLIVDAGELSEAEESLQLAEELKEEVLAVVESSGRIGKLVFPRAAGVEARNQWRNLLARWQFVFPEEDSATEWTTNEDDPTGEYRAVYEREIEDGRTRIVKVKDEYTRTRARRTAGGKSRELSGTMLVDGETVMELDRWPVRVEGYEEIATPRRGFRMRLEGEAHFVFRLESHTSGQMADPLRTALVGSSPGTTLGVAELANRARSDGPVAIEQLLESTAAVLASHGIRSSEAVRSLGRLIDALQRDPGAAETVFAMVRDPATGGDLSSVLLSALGNAGTPGCQRVLREIFSADDLPVGRRRTALISLAHVEEPEADLDRTLFDLHERRTPLSRSALLILGVAGNRVRDTDSERFDEIASYIDEVSTGAHRAEDLVLGLEAYGNLGTEEVPRIVQDALGHRDDSVRAAAARALTRTEDPVADHLLAAMGRADASEDVRASAIDTLAERQSEVAKSISMELALGDPSERIRQSALRNLAVLAHDPDVRSTIEWIAHHDRSESVRSAASAALQAN